MLYRDAAGEPLTAPRVLARIESLRIPPAWDEVWICRRADGHLQATGRDTCGRKQYRYHPDWNATRNQTKYHRMGQFGVALPGMRERIDADLARRGLPRDKVLAAAALAAFGPADSETAARHNVVQVVKDVAGALGNLPATCRKYYVHPAVLAAYASGALAANWADDVAAAETEPAAGLSAEESAFLALLRRAAPTGG